LSFRRSMALALAMYRSRFTFVPPAFQPTTG
jgi:hypothetical protein